MSNPAGEKSNAPSPLFCHCYLATQVRQAALARAGVIRDS